MVSIKPLSVLVLALLLASTFICLMGIQPAQASDVRYYDFQGPLNENEPASFIPGYNATVTVHFSSGTTTSTFDVNSSMGYVTYTAGSMPLYFSYDLSAIYGTNVTREYWLSADEQNMTSGTFDWLSIYAPIDKELTPITFNVFGFSSIEAFDGGAFLLIDTVYPSGMHAIEKRPIDSLGDIVCMLQANTVYEVSIETADGGTVYSLGQVSTVTSTITLSASSVSFSSESLLKYPYVSFYGYREFSNPFGYIVINYNDTKASTTSFSLSISDMDNVVVYSYGPVVANTVSVNWTSAVNATIYKVDVTVTHGLYGDLSWTQTFGNQAGDNAALFSLAFLGDWAFDTSFLLPALIVLLVAACFSALNAEVGAVLTCIAALVLSYMGWLPIGAGALVAAFSFAILMALLYNRRRVTLY